MLHSNNDFNNCTKNNIVTLCHDNIYFDYDKHYLRETIGEGFLQSIVTSDYNTFFLNVKHNIKNNITVDDIDKISCPAIDIKLKSVLDNLYDLKRYSGSPVSEIDNNHLANCLLSYLHCKNSTIIKSTCELEDRVLKDIGIIYFGHRVSRKMMNVISYKRDKSDEKKIKKRKIYTQEMVEDFFADKPFYLL